MNAEHGGNIRALALELGCSEKEISDMSSNLNPFGPPDGLVAHLQGRLSEIFALPEVDARAMIQDFAGFYELDPARVIAGNGTTQLIDAIPQALSAEKPLILGPTYSEYARACRMHALKPQFFVAESHDDFCPDIRALSRAVAGHDLVFLCNPNNPTGAMIPRRELLALVDEHPRVRFVVDESYLPFVTGAENTTLIRVEQPNLFILNSMSKIFRIPGLRVGFLVGPAGVMPSFTPFSQPWSVNALAQSAVRFLMRNRQATKVFLHKSRQLMQEEKSRFLRAAAQCDFLHFFPGVTYFLLASVSKDHCVRTICRDLGRKRILIRDCANFEGLPPGFLRISLKTANENQTLLAHLLRLFTEPEQQACLETLF